MTYNPETYGWYQCDEEDYDSSASPEEQAEDTAARRKWQEKERNEAEALLAFMRVVVAQVPSYCERYQRAAETVQRHKEAQAKLRDAPMVWRMELGISGVDE